MKRYLSVLVGIILSISSYLIPPAAAASKASEESQEITHLRSTFEKELKRINEEQANAINDLQEQYIGSLNVLESTMQKAGKLEPLLAIRKERERFKTEREIRDVNLLQDVLELLTLQVEYRKALEEKLPLERAKKIVALAQQYDNSLNNLQVKLTQKGNLEAAINVKSERESLEKRSEVTAARFVIADAEVKMQKNLQENEAAPPKVVSPQPEKKADITAGKKYTGKTENYIRKRYTALCDSIINQDWKKAMEYIDPDFVKTRGYDAVEMQLGFVFPFLKLTEKPQFKLKTGDVTVDEDKQRATLIPKIWFNNGWHEQPAVDWIEVDGEWYLDMKQRSWPAPPPRPHLRRR